LYIEHQKIRVIMETLKDLLEEAKRRTILVAILVLIVAYVMSCTLVLLIKPDGEYNFYALRSYSLSCTKVSYFSINLN